MSTNAFQVGKTYAARSACNYDCIWRFTVTKRTFNFITLEEESGDVKRVKVFADTGGVEWAKPLGTFSMNPIIRADKEIY